MKWILVFYMSNNPVAYHPHWAFGNLEACQQRAERYASVYKLTGSQLQAECRPVAQVNLRNPNDIVVKQYTLY